jgi:hypothetical protein
MLHSMKKTPTFSQVLPPPYEEDSEIYSKSPTLPYERGQFLITPIYIDSPNSVKMRREMKVKNVRSGDATRT